MEIKSEHDFNAKSVRALRESLGMNQSNFWGAVCVSTARGSAYEIERNKIPAPVKRLLWLHYFMGFNTQTVKVPEENAAINQARETLANAKSQIDQALKTLPLGTRRK